MEENPFYILGTSKFAFALRANDFDRMATSGDIYSDMYSRCWGVEGLENDLDHLLPVSLGVEGSLGVEMRGLVGRDSQLVVEGVVPDLLHVVPVGHDTVLDGVFQGKDTLKKWSREQ